jgi:peptidoglycan hydrolase-like protein with peptidoglycan-binding domain
VSDNPQLQSGSSDEEWVKYLQQLLELAGHSPGAADGDFGPATEAAVRAFQQGQGLAVDGVVGSNTWDALAAATGATSSTPTTNDSTQAASGDAAVDGTTGSVADWGPDPTQWSEAQQNQYFTYNDVADTAEGFDADVDVPEIQEA